jgi:chromate reductase
MPNAPFRILGIPGSLRRLSWNRGLLVAAQEVAPPGIAIDVTDLLPIPLYNADVEVATGFPPSVVAFRREIVEADALLIAVPEYNYSLPGVLKNAIDWASRPPGQVLQYKPVALMGAGGKGGTVRSQLMLRQVFVTTETYVLPKPELYVRNAAASFDADGRLIDVEVRDQLPPLLAALVKWAAAVAHMRDAAP